MTIRWKTILLGAALGAAFASGAGAEDFMAACTAREGGDGRLAGKPKLTQSYCQCLKDNAAKSGDAAGIETRMIAVMDLPASERAGAVRGDGEMSKVVNPCSQSLRTYLQRQGQ